MNRPILKALQALSADEQLRPILRGAVCGALYNCSEEVAFTHILALETRVASGDRDAVIEFEHLADQAYDIVVEYDRLLDAERR